MIVTMKKLMFEQLQAGSSCEQRQHRLAVAQTAPKLPELKLPTFSDRMSDWVTYKNLIHNDINLSDMDEFTYCARFTSAMLRFVEK